MQEREEFTSLQFCVMFNHSRDHQTVHTTRRKKMFVSLSLIISNVLIMCICTLFAVVLCCMWMLMSVGEYRDTGREFLNSRKQSVSITNFLLNNKTNTAFFLFIYPDHCLYLQEFA